MNVGLENFHIYHLTVFAGLEFGHCLTGSFARLQSRDWPRLQSNLEVIKEGCTSCLMWLLSEFSSLKSFGIRVSVCC